MKIKHYIGINSFITSVCGKNYKNPTEDDFSFSTDNITCEECLNSEVYKKERAMK